jgi:hypothetical protein
MGSRVLLVVLCALGCSLGCARDPLRPYPGEPTPPFRPSVDDSPEWSHDGRLIAYHRRFASTDGPPGLYVIDAAGGVPRFLAGGGFWSPTYLRFSPDDRSIACELGQQLMLVNLQTGVSTQPLYTQNGATQPDWSPDGRSIVYSRLISSASDPPESLGLHMLDITTGADNPIFHQGAIQFGRYPVFSQDGQEIAIVEGVGGNQSRISLLRTDGSDLHALIESPFGYLLGGLRRHARLALGINGLAFGGFTSAGVGPFVMNWDGSGLSHLPPTYHDYDAYSPDGSMGVGPRYDPADSLVVLFVFRSNDITGATYRQLTSYAPPTQ